VEMEEAASKSVWRALRDVAPFQGTQEAVWRLSVPPASGAGVIHAIAGSGVAGARHFYDWGGGLIFLALPAEGDAAASRIRAAPEPMGGHATLIGRRISLRDAGRGCH